MNRLLQAVEKIRAKLEKLRRQTLKETPTRTIVIDPLLEALGWDVRDPDEVQLEYPTVDGKFVDYALKINGRPVLLVEAKPLDDPLTDVKAITQVVGYASNDGIVWCVLTNGIRWRVYRSIEECPAPEKLMFEVDLDPSASLEIPLKDLVAQLWRISAEEMAKGTLDALGEQTFTDGKVRKALESIMLAPPASFLRLVRRTAGDETLSPRTVQQSLGRVWAGRTGGEITPAPPRAEATPKGAHDAIHRPRVKRARGATKGRTLAGGFDESYHASSKPREVLELYRALDQAVLSLEPGEIKKRYAKFSISYVSGNHQFCWVNIQRSGLRVWLKLKYDKLEAPPPFVRDVSNVGHWGGGSLELAITNFSQLETASSLIRRSLEGQGGERRA